MMIFDLVHIVKVLRTYHFRSVLLLVTTLTKHQQHFGSQAKEYLQHTTSTYHAGQMSQASIEMYQICQRI